MKRAQKSHSPLLFYSLLSSSLRSLVTQTRTGSKSHGHAKSTTLCIRGRLIRGGAASYTIRLNWRAVSGAKISGPDSRLIYFAILHMGQTIPNSLGVAKVLRKSNLPVIHIVAFAAFPPPSLSSGYIARAIYALFGFQFCGSQSESGGLETRNCFLFPIIAALMANE